jgi:prohibitin 2
MNLLILIGLAVIVFGIVVVIQGTQGQKPALRGLGGITVVIGVVIALLSSSFVIVPAGNVGVVFNVFGGVQENELGEGFHIVLPFIQQVTLYDVRQNQITLARETGDEIAARSSEGLDISIDATIIYQINRNAASQLHRDIGPSYQEIRLRPEIRSQVRDGIAEFNAADLISTQRAALGRLIEEALRRELQDDNINVLSVLLRDVRIPQSITSAIEEKQAAEQQVQVEENRRRQAEIAAQRRIVEAQGERDAEVARAQGEADALRLRGEAIRANPEIIQLEIAQKLSPSIQTILLPADGNFLLDMRALTGGNP